MRDDQGNVVGVTAFSLDISERIEAEEELRRINFELDSFVYRSSHDLRAPLRSVLGLVSLVRMAQDAAPRDHYLRLMEKSIDKLDMFIRDMTDFSRNSRQEVQAVPVDFRAIIAESTDNLRYIEHADRVSLRVSVEGEGFYSDPQRISTVFQNLMSNSVKYQRLHIDDAFIEFRIHCTPQEARIVYTDNGKGIEHAHLDKIFDMFFRASADSYGSGLGLYITRQVVKKLNGTIRVQSQPGQGTEFVITLPNLHPAAAGIPALPPSTT
jgi:signal transduction histidine kinase